MTRRTLFASAFFCAVFTVAAFAADISGSWTGSMHAGDDAVPLTFTFKQDGEKLTGSVVSPQSEQLPLHDGKVTGDKISFWVQADMNGTPTKFVVEGAVKGDQISVNISAEGGPDFGATLLTRAK